MGDDLRLARNRIKGDPRLSGFEVRRQGEELHLEKGGDVFARLLPARKGTWRIEVFRETEEWEILDFTGPLDECLGFLVVHPQYLFWER